MREGSSFQTSKIDSANFLEPRIALSNQSRRFPSRRCSSRNVPPLNSWAARLIPRGQILATEGRSRTPRGADPALRLPSHNVVTVPNFSPPFVALGQPMLATQGKSPQLSSLLRSSCARIQIRRRVATRLSPVAIRLWLPARNQSAPFWPSRQNPSPGDTRRWADDNDGRHNPALALRPTQRRGL